MNKLRLGLIFLGIVAVVALAGLTLMLTKPAIGGTDFAIGESYTWGQQRGIAQTYPAPPYRKWTGPLREYPAWAPTVTTIGRRTPFMIFFKGEYGNIYESSKCWADLFPYIPAPKDKFSCYVVPTTGVAYEVTGWFPPSSSASPRPPVGYEGGLGGDVNCYLRTPLDRDAMYSKLYPIVKKKGWTTVEVNNQDVLMCSKGAYFIFPQ